MDTHPKNFKPAPDALYVHVPFCPKVCHYCDFAVLKASEKLHQSWWECLQLEIETRQPAGLATNSNPKKKWDTIYFGGGTPSLLSTELWAEILDYFHDHYDLSALRELTLEVNPETLTQDRLDLWMSRGVNRISMGVQSFDDDILETLGRSCEAHEARDALKMLQDSKVNYSADLMFGLPGQSVDSFLADLEELMTYHPSHVSFYGLTVEQGTLFDQWLKRGVIHIDDEIQSEMYLKGVELLKSYGIERYELSNFAKPGFEAVHNSKYWNDDPYLGVGPGAHSYNGRERAWNHKHLAKWSRAEGVESVEVLTQADKKNEYIWLSLRQEKGLNLEVLRSNWGMELATSWLSQWSEQVALEEGQLKLKNEGWLLIDEITMSLI